MVLLRVLARLVIYLKVWLTWLMAGMEMLVDKTVVELGMLEMSFARPVYIVSMTHVYFIN